MFRNVFVTFSMQRRYIDGVVLVGRNLSVLGSRLGAVSAPCPRREPRGKRVACDTTPRRKPTPLPPECAPEASWAASLRQTMGVASHGVCGA